MAYLESAKKGTVLLTAQIIFQQLIYIPGQDYGNLNEQYERKVFAPDHFEKL